MRNPTVIVILAIAALVTGPVLANEPEPGAQPQTRKVATELDPAAKETILLVSLDDGTVIMQTIHSTADICFKSASRSSTTCLTRGAPIIDPITDTTVGFEMIEDQIDLVAKQD